MVKTFLTDAAARKEWEESSYTSEQIGHEACEDVFTMLRQGYYALAATRLRGHQQDAWHAESARRLIAEAKWESSQENS